MHIPITRIILVAIVDESLVLSYGGCEFEFRQRIAFFFHLYFIYLFIYLLFIYLYVYTIV